MVQSKTQSRDRARDTARDSGQPPYFNIDPDRALRDLDAPVGTARFAEIAEALAERTGSPK